MTPDADVEATLNFSLLNFNVEPSLDTSESRLKSFSAPVFSLDSPKYKPRSARDGACIVTCPAINPLCIRFVMPEKPRSNAFDAICKSSGSFRPARSDSGFFAVAVRLKALRFKAAFIVAVTGMERCGHEMDAVTFDTLKVMPRMELTFIIPFSI